MMSGREVIEGRATAKQFSSTPSSPVAKGAERGTSNAALGNQVKRRVMHNFYNLSSSLGITSGTFDIAFKNDFLLPFNALSLR